MRRLELTPRQLRSRLLLFAALAVLPSLVVIAGTQWFARQRALQTTIDESRRLAHAAAMQQAMVFTGTEKLLRTLADSRIGRSPVECNAALAAVQRDHTAQTAVFVMDPTGIVVCPRAAASNTYRDREWFQRAVASRQTTLGDFQISRFSGEPDVVMAFPHIDAGGDIDYVYAAALDLRELARTAAIVPLPRSSVLTVLDRQRTILVRYPDSPESIGQRAPGSGAFDRIRDGADDDVREDLGADNVRRLWTTVPVNIGIDSGLILAVAVSDAVAFAPANELLRRSAVLFAIVIAATMVVGWSAGQVFVLRPLGLLTDAIRRLARGDLAARVKFATAVPGLHEVTEALNEMAEALEGRQRDHEQLRLLGHAIESTSDMVSVTDLENRYTFVNGAFLRTYGYALDEVIGQTPALLRSAATPTSTADEIHAKTRAGGWHGQLRNRRKDGTELFVALDTTPVRTEDGQILGLLRTARDVSDQLKAERLLREVQERMRFALTASQVGIWEGNLVTGEFYWSDVQEQLHGLMPGTFGGTLSAFFDSIHPDDRQRVRRTIKQASRGGREVEFEYRTLWPDQTEHWIRTSVHYVVDARRVTVRGAGIAIDVTERRNLEAQLRQSQKIEAVGQLAGGIAHDFNNMLTAILGNAELVLDDLSETDPHYQDLLEIQRAARRSSELTHQLLAFSRKQILTPRVLHVGDVIAPITPMLRRLLGEQITLRATVNDRQSVKADDGQLEQVLVNLAVNARDAMPAGGVLTIETADLIIHSDRSEDRIVPPGSYATIAVRDTGVGMDAATQARIFEPFFTTKPKGQGSGLGLATAYGIIKQSGGYIVVSSAVGRGACFTIYLPHTTEVDVPVEAETVPTQPVGGNETILIVEDEQFVREFATKVLTRFGYSVHTAPTGLDALRFAADYTGTIDLVLTDVVLPDVTGRQTAEGVCERHPETKVLYMSGYTDDIIVHDGVLDEGTSLLSKPFTIETLLTYVRHMLSSRVIAMQSRNVH